MKVMARSTPQLEAKEEQLLLEQITERFYKANEDSDETVAGDSVRKWLPWSVLFKLQDRSAIFEFRFLHAALDQFMAKLTRLNDMELISISYFFVFFFSGSLLLANAVSGTEYTGISPDSIKFFHLMVGFASLMMLLSLPDSVPLKQVHSKAVFCVLTVFYFYSVLQSQLHIGSGVVRATFIVVMYVSSILRFRLVLLYCFSVTVLSISFSLTFHDPNSSALDDVAWVRLVADSVELVLANIVGAYCYIVSMSRSKNSFGTLVENIALVRQNEEEGSIRKEWVRKVMPKIVVEPYEKFKFNQSLLRKSNTGLIVPYHEEYIFASMLFADIVNFTMMSAGRSASEVVHILNRIYGAFDISASRLHIEKIGTLGDCYYCVSGVPVTERKRVNMLRTFASRDSQRNQAYYVLCSIAMGLEMCEKIQAFNDSMGLPDEQRVDMRIGVHWGTLNALIIGASRYKFDIYSDDALMANNMESGGEKGHVRISFKCYYLLEQNGCKIEIASFHFKDNEDPEYYTAQDQSENLRSRRRRRPKHAEGAGNLATKHHMQFNEGKEPPTQILGKESQRYKKTFSFENLHRAQMRAKLQRCIVVWKRKDGSISSMTKKAFNREKVPFELTGVEGVASRKNFSEEEKHTQERKVRKDLLDEESLMENLRQNEEKVDHLMRPQFTHLGYFSEKTYEYLYRIRYFLPASYQGTELTRMSYLFAPLLDQLMLLLFNMIFTMLCFYCFRENFDDSALLFIGCVFCASAFKTVMLLADGFANILNDCKQKITHRYCRLNVVDRRETIALRLYHVLYDEKFAQSIQFVQILYPLMLLSLIARNCAMHWLVYKPTDFSGKPTSVEDQFQKINATRINNFTYLFLKCMDISFLSSLIMHSASFTTMIISVFIKQVFYVVFSFSYNTIEKTAASPLVMWPPSLSIVSGAFVIFCIPLAINRQKTIRTDFFASYLSNKEMVQAKYDKQKINKVIFDLYPMNLVPKLIAISNTDEKSMSIMEKALKGDFALHHERVSPASVIFTCICTGDHSLSTWFKNYYPSQSASWTDSGQAGQRTAMEIVVLNSIICAMDEELAKMQFIDKIKSYRDTYLAVSGLSVKPMTMQMSPKAPHIALMLFSLNLVHSKLSAFKMIEDQINLQAKLADRETYNPSQAFKIRFKVGFCVGDVIAGTIGKDKPAFDIWGNTVNTASRMYSNGTPDMIQCLVDTVEYLKEYFEFTPVGYKSIKGLGVQMTYAVKGLRLNKLRSMLGSQAASC